MRVNAGMPGRLGSFLTTEARWFFQGDAPPELINWFEGRSGVEIEHRLDTYDLRAAHRGVGIKLRDSGLLDHKTLLAASEDVELRPFIRGDVEEWLKITETPDDQVHLGRTVEVHKKIRTWHHFDGQGVQSGCAVELVSVRMEGVVAWSFCLETFGDAENRDKNLADGLKSFLAGSSLPHGIALKADASCSYPEWISLVDAEMNLVG